jgi:hypothetical protein
VCCSRSDPGSLAGADVQNSLATGHGPQRATAIERSGSWRLRSSPWPLPPSCWRRKSGGWPGEWNQLLLEIHVKGPAHQHLTDHPRETQAAAGSDHRCSQRLRRDDRRLALERAKRARRQVAYPARPRRAARPSFSRSPAHCDDRGMTTRRFPAPWRATDTSLRLFRIRRITDAHGVGHARSSVDQLFGAPQVGQRGDHV